MKTRVIGVLLSLILVPAACADAPAPTALDLDIAGAAVAKGKSSHSLPFMGRWEADGPPPPPVSPAGLCREGAVAATLHTYSGHATHFGAFTMDAVLCQFPGPLYGTYEGEATITTANGDEVHAVFTDGHVTGVRPPILFMQDRVQFVGGTGRFTHVSGGGLELIEFDMTKGYGQAEMRGTIRYRASDRAPRR